MGSRALIAYQRRDGKFNVHYSHQGASDFTLCDDITASAPLGGEATEPEVANEFIAALESNRGDNAGDVAGYLTQPQEPTAVESDPELVCVPMSEAAAYVDGCNDAIEVFYVVAPDFTVRAFQRLELQIGDVNKGSLLLEPRWYNGEPQSATYDKGMFQGSKSTLTSLVTDDILTEEEAVTRLKEGILSRIHPHPHQQILAHSPAASHDDYVEHLPAFLKPTGLSRMNGEEIVSGFDDYDPWELPDDFPNPMLATRKGSNDQLEIDLF